jgi:tRNA U34 2-thiouridine synthase MnmA/TrmU
MEPGTNRLVVGFHEELAVVSLRADGFRAAADLPAEGPPDCGGPWTAQIRHRHPGVPVRHWRLNGAGELDVELAAPVFGAAPGQGLALFEGDMVLGAGRLTAAAPA